MNTPKITIMRLEFECPPLKKKLMNTKCEAEWSKTIVKNEIQKKANHSYENKTIRTL